MTAKHPSVPPKWVTGVEFVPRQTRVKNVIRTLILGVLAAVLAVAVLMLLSLFNFSGLNGVLAVTGGLILGLIRDKSPLARYGAYLVGMVLGIIAVLAAEGGWIGFVVLIVVFTIISALTGGKLPLWAMILGGCTFGAMYVPYLTATAWYVLTQYPSTFFLALAASSGAFIVAVLTELLLGAELEKEGKLPTAETSTAPDQLMEPAQ